MDLVTSVDQLTHRCYQDAKAVNWVRTVTKTVSGVRGVVICYAGKTVIKYAELPNGDVRVLWLTNDFSVVGTSLGVDCILGALKRKLVDA